MFHSVYHNTKCIAAYAGATISTNTNTDSAIKLDSQGYESVQIAVYSGAITDGAYELQIRESANADGSSDSAATVFDTVSFGTSDDSVVKTVGAKLTKRYFFLRIVSTGTSSGGVFKGAIAILGNARSNPVTYGHA